MAEEPEEEQEQTLTLVWKPQLLIGKAKWDIALEDIVHDCGEDKYVQGGMSLGFTRLVYAMLDHEPDKKEFTTSASEGYRELQSLRNEAQRKELEEKVVEKLPEWQRATAAKSEKPKRCSRTEQEKQRAAKDVMEVEVPGVDDKPARLIKMLRPVLNGDELICLLDTVSLMHILRFIADKRIDKNLKRQGPLEDAPKGTKRKGDQYLIKLPEGAIEEARQSSEASKIPRSKTVSSIDACRQVINEPDKFIKASPGDSDIAAGERRKRGRPKNQPADAASSAVEASNPMTDEAPDVVANELPLEEHDVEPAEASADVSEFFC